MDKFLNMFLLNLLFLIQVTLAQGWESLYTLPETVKGATSVASDGYGVHLVGVYDGSVKHFWVGNNNTVIWSTLSVPGGEMPQVTLYDNTVRVTMKITESNQQKIRIYQSQDGGYAWTQLSDYIPVGQPPIYNLYAYSDKYGTHITWDDNPDPEYTNEFQNEVYYVRLADPQQSFQNFKNVTELSLPSQGGRPKVTVSGNKACIAFVGGPGALETLTSRDINLDNGLWDSFYRLGLGNTPYRGLSITSIGDMLYTVGPSDIIVDLGCSQLQFFSYRHKDDTEWTTPGLLGDCTSGGNMRNTLINVGGLLHLINYNPQKGVVAQTFNPSTGEWSYPYEIIEEYTGDQLAGSQMVAGGQYGIYYFYDGTSSSYHQHMRHKALVPNITINSTVGSGWNLISIPLGEYQLFKSQVYPSATSGPYSYDDGYIFTDPISVNRGYWIQFPAAQNINYTGARADSMKTVVKTGWNIIGSISSTVLTSSVVTDPTGIVNSAFFKYVSGGGYKSVGTIEPGQGIWVSVSQNGHITLEQNSLGKDMGDEFVLYDKFIVTDNVGNSQELFVRNSQMVGTTESIKMPPVIPQAEFDARFETNDIVRTINPGNSVVDISINVSASYYPVTLTWELNPENGINYSFGNGSLAKISSTGNFILNKGAGIIKLTGSYNSAKLGLETPNSYSLYQNYPNPFNPSTTIFYSVKNEENVTIKVYDVLSNEVDVLVNERKSAGSYSVTFDASNLSSGIYFYRLTAGNFTETKKLILMK